MTSRRIARLGALVALTATALSGCQGNEIIPASYSGPSATSTPTSSFERVLTALGADRVYVMAGNNVIKAGLGILKPDRFGPVHLRPDPDLVSNVSGNGKRIVIGAAVLHGGFAADGVYLMNGRQLVRLARPGAGKFGPTIANNRTVAAIQPQAGFSTLAAGANHWTKDLRFGHANVSSLSWVVGGDAYSVLHPHRPRAQLVRLGAKGGAQRLGQVHCAGYVLAAPGRNLLVTSPSNRAKVRSDTRGCRGGYVITTQGQTKTKLPARWRVLAWSADSAALLLTKGHTLAVWSLRGHFVARADIGVHAWMAAPVYH